MIHDDDLFVVIVDETNDAGVTKVNKQGNEYKPKPDSYTIVYEDDWDSEKVQIKQEIDDDDEVENILYTAKEHGEILHLNNSGDVEGIVKSEIDEEYYATNLIDSDDDFEPHFVCEDESSDSSEEQDSEYKERPRKTYNGKRMNTVSYVQKLKKAYPKLRKDEDILIKLLTHKMKETHPPDPPPNCVTYDGCYRCDMCNTESPSESIAIKHYQEKHGERYLFCYACGATFRSTTNLYKHEKMNCQSRDIQVVLKARALSLGRKGKSRPYIPDLSNEPPKRYECTECSATFASKNTLEPHLRMHRGERPFLCPICPRAYTSSIVLSHHVKKHGNKAFICDHCNRSFKEKGKLVVHMDTHAPMKRYGCEECPKRFATKANLMIHVNRDHRDLPLPLDCKICPKRFARMSTLKIHMRKNHGMVVITSKMFSRHLPEMTEKQLETQLQRAIVVLKNPTTPSNVKEEFQEF